MNDSSIQDGGPAFPITPPSPYQSDIQPATGMTLRDWFAGQALLGMDFADSLQQAIEEGYKATEAGGFIATACYKMADAMIEARKLHPTTTP